MPRSERIHYMLVISPKILGKARLRRFHKHLNSYPGMLPPLVHIEGVDKNLVNFEEFRHCVFDQKDWGMRLKLWLGLEKYQLNFREKGKDFTELKGEHGQKWKSGTICCALSHLEAWQFVAKAPGMCLILEDDAHISHDQNFTHISLPCEDADLISIYKTKIHNYERFSDSYLKLLPQADGSTTSKVNKNSGLSGYFLAPRGAQKLLQKVVPINSGIDMETYRLARCQSFKMFATTEDWLVDRGARVSLIKTKHRRLKSLKIRLRDLKKRYPAAA